VDVIIKPGLLRGNVKAIPSKSQAHRAFICAALANIQATTNTNKQTSKQEHITNPTHIECDGTSDDIEATKACLSALETQNEKQVTLPCGESGSTFRFLLPIAGALGRKASFLLEGRLPERPLSPLYEELVKHGCKMSPQGSNPFTIEGQLTPGKYILNAGISSQFISGLLFALPLLNEDSEIHLTGSIESFPYIELTIAMLEVFNIKIKFENMIFFIPRNQIYQSPGTLKVEGDWSNAAFWLCANAIPGNKITVSGLDMNSKQGDRAVLEILKQFGNDPDDNDSDNNKLHGIEIDATDIPDLVPILSVVAASAEGTTIIRNAGRLRIKESDRLAAVTDLLSILGADIKETEDGLIINGGKPLTGGTVSSHSDHRIAMSAAIAAVLCNEPVIIRGAEAVNKSYPTFFEERRRLECPHNTEKN